MRNVLVGMLVLASAQQAHAANHNFTIDSGGYGDDDQPLYRNSVIFDDAELECALAPLKSLPKNAGPEAERYAIAQTILLWEQQVVPKLEAQGLKQDKGGWEGNSDERGQLKCLNVADTLNRFLHGLQDHGYLPPDVVISPLVARGNHAWTEHWGAAISFLPADPAANCVGKTGALRESCLASCGRDPKACREAYAKTDDHRWVLDGWPYDMGTGLCVENAADWKSGANCSDTGEEGAPVVPEWKPPAACRDLPAFAGWDLRPSAQTVRAMKSVYIDK